MSLNANRTSADAVIELAQQLSETARENRELKSRVRELEGVMSKQNDEIKKLTDRLIPHVLGRRVD